MSIAQKLAEDITSDVNPMSYTNRTEHVFVITDITNIEVAQVISALKKTQMLGWDELSTLVAKKYVLSTELK